MFKLAFQLLMSRRKWLIILISILALIISSIISIFSSSETIKSNLKNFSFQQYGKFSGVLLNMPHDDNYAPNKSGLGEFILSDSSVITTNEKKATVGWVDRNFIEIGNILLRSGEFPKNHNEVAIESYYLESIDPDWEVGTTKTIKIGNQIKPFKLVGIVENYSAKWYSGPGRYPNLFVSKSFLPNPIKSNFLIEYKIDKSIDTNLNEARSLINNNDRNGFINERLFYKGLNDHQNIIMLSTSLQISILLLSTLCLFTIFSFFNTNQRIKFGIFKSLGSSNRQLYAIFILQIIYIVIFGIIISIPLIVLLHYLIVKNTYGFSIFKLSVVVDFLPGVIYWFLILLSILILLSFFTIKKELKESIKTNLMPGGDTFGSSELVSKTKNFYIKQLFIQLGSHPKHSVLSSVTLSLSILVVLISITVAKEAAGIWNTKIDYYLSSQEDIYSKVIEGHHVLTSQESTFSPLDVKRIESMKGIKYVKKEPFMFNVNTIIERENLTPTLNYWVQKYDQKIGNTNVKEVIIPNVKFFLMSEEEIINAYSIDREEVPTSVFLYVPGIKDDERTSLLGSEVTLSKMYLSNNEIERKKLNLTVRIVDDQPFAVKLENETLTNNQITIVLNENLLFEQGISHGYKDLTIYTDDNLSQNDSLEIYDNIYAISAGYQGSLFQYIPDLIHDTTRISDFLVFLGRVAFFISITLSICSIYIVIYGKYQLQKRYWGIYRSMGMNTKTVFLFLLSEALVYFSASSIISFFLYLIFIYLSDMSYTTGYYLTLFFITIITVFLLLTSAATILKKKLSKDPIAILLKVED